MFLKKNKHKKDSRINVRHTSIKDFFVLFIVLAAFNGFHMWIYRILEHSEIMENNLRLGIGLLMFYVILTAVIITVSIGVVRYRTWTIPIKKLGSAARKIAKGDLTVRVTPLRKDGKKDIVEVLFDDFNSMTEALENAHTEKDNLMNTISHDLKNYIGATSQAIELYTLKNETLKENKYIQMSLVSNNRALNLVAEILYSTKLDATKDSVVLKHYNLNEVIAETENSLIMRANNKNINVTFEYTTEPTFVMLDIDKWSRIYENLTTNALKFTNRDGNITIKTQSFCDNIQISVKDSGIGIPIENIPKLFKQFSGVGRKGTAGEESTGIGLSIVKKLVELQNGNIEVKSEVGTGTEFIITFKKGIGNSPL